MIYPSNVRSKALLYIQMIDYEKYITNSLRKGRAQSFQKDIEQVYKLYMESMDAESITINEFDLIWTQSSMKFIFQCKTEEEDEDEYAQLLYQIIFKQYFLNQSKKNKIFSLFSLYFLYYSCERRKKIFISKPYLDELAQFLKDNAQDRDYYYMKISLHLYNNCFCFATKVGIRNPMLQPNGEVVKKLALIKTDPMSSMRTINEQLKSIGHTYSEYIKMKEQIEKGDKKPTKETKLNNTDKYFVSRLENLFDNYDKAIQNERDSQT